jgi:nanoRNase/pAp phosphatase (c-di-AMP/oligoRNAs hydrolase)
MKTKIDKGRKRSRAQQKGAARLLEMFSGMDKVLILINPDPDSMASALAVKRLLGKRVQKICIAHIGEIARLDNLAMKRLLNIPVVKIDQITPHEFSRYVLVDSQPDHSEIFAAFEYDVIIDHHPKKRTWNAGYIDIRPDYGANSTILVDYLREAGIRPSMKLATALLYGIKTDTASFERHTSLHDIEQFQYVFQYANINILKKIESSDLRENDLQYFEKALQRRSILRKHVYAHLGHVSNTDICVQIADFFMRVGDMTWSIVSAVSDDKLVVILRNDGYRKDAGKVATQAFGQFGPAGGHRGAARANILLEALQAEGVSSGDGLQTFVKHRLKL